mmetsp:Transcript_27403/g.51211  ORF Transcript_27403/g.51211 Transcript_27403/m.51211 type:complete len:342 (-) Transcript_27403:810-1835(-)
MSHSSGPYFANVVEISGMEGGNSALVNGYYIPSSARQFSFPVYTKFCQRSNSLTSTKLCILYQKRRYYWVVRDEEFRVLARVKYPPNSQSSLTLPEHVPKSLCWELLSTGFFANFKKKPDTQVTACDDNVLLQQMSSFIGSNGYMDSVSESIRFIDSAVQDMQGMLTESQQSSSGGDNYTPTDDENYLNGIDVDIEDLSMDQIIELYSSEIFNGYGSLVPRQEGQGAGGSGIPFTTVQEQLEAKVSASLSSSIEMQQLLSKLADEAPEEFIDPITLLIMEQPMAMPTSRNRMDRKTLSAHLAINPSDPFNRQPLTMDMIYPDVALKMRIDEWLQAHGVEGL